MSDYFSRPDGEIFVDVAMKPIPPADTWETLSMNQLIEVQVTLQTRVWDFRANPAIATPLNASIQRLRALIDRKIAEGS